MTVKMGIIWPYNVITVKIVLATSVGRRGENHQTGQQGFH